MKYADINRRYTEIVNEYIGKGYTINTATMSGTQGERAKVDFTDGKEIIRIMVDSFHCWAGDVEEEGIEIIVGKSTDDIKPNSNDSWCTVWSNKLEIISRERFYKIGRRDYYGTQEEAHKASTIRLERCRMKYDSNEEYVPSEKAIQIAKSIVRNKMGYKRIADSEVKLKKGKEGYVVLYGTKMYRLS